MAASVSLSTEPINFGGGLIFVCGTITFDSSYPTGGESISASSFKGSSFVRLMLDPSTTGIVPSYNSSTGKVMAFWVDTTVDGAAMAEVTATTDLSTAVFPFAAWVRP